MKVKSSKQEKGGGKLSDFTLPAVLHRAIPPVPNWAHGQHNLQLGIHVQTSGNRAPQGCRHGIRLRHPFIKPLRWKPVAVCHNKWRVFVPAATLRRVRPSRAQGQEKKLTLPQMSRTMGQLIVNRLQANFRVNM
eukprot:CAMPEP_0172610016 /NCGR_PEP_ID=MMETSP1068-20121228/29888_1 /TAXON_ID=35684 /ORGANISM="Pseudopedinella elastica, Strain CCMP716" /LENGTH=133 /DNA_ID=CAMNT_0013413643 /DNA_START=686 /DNA_END=1087 /DNA_ORIENTATION=+